MSAVHDLPGRETERDRPVPDESLEWVSLGEHVRGHGVLDVESLREVVTMTAASLVAAHRAGQELGVVGPDRIRVIADGPEVIDVEPLRAEDRPVVPGDGLPSGPQQLAAQARDVFGWAASMVFAATGVLPTGAGTPPGDEARERLAERRDLPDWLPDLLWDCLGEAWQRPTAREVAYRLSSGPAAVAKRDPDPPIGSDHPTVGISVPSPVPPPDAPDDQLPRRRPLRLLAVGAAVVVVAAGGAVVVSRIGWGPLSTFLSTSATPETVGAYPATAPSGTARGGTSPEAMSAVPVSPTSMPPTPRSRVTKAPVAKPPAGKPPTGPRTRPSTPARAGLAATLTGQWQGTLAQSQARNALAVQLDLKGLRPGTITLSELGCAGTLTVQQNRPDEVVYRDVLTSDPLQQCSPSGTLTVSRVDARTLMLSWVSTAAPANIAAGFAQKV